MKPVRLHILDVNGSAFRAIRGAPPLTNSKGVQTGGVFVFTKMILSYQQRHTPTHLVAVWDAPGRSFRKDLYPEYKSKRPPLPEEIKLQLKLCRAVVRALPLPTLSVAGVEADDTIASLVVKMRAQGHDPVVVSSDKDLHQLMGQAEIYDPVQAAFITAEKVKEKWGVAPRQISELLALAGDSSDDIPGVPGVGLKTAARLLVKYETIDRMLENLEEVPGSRGVAIRNAVQDGTLELWRRLAALKKDVDVPGDVAAFQIPPPDEMSRRFLFEALEFNSLMPSDMPTLEELMARAAGPVYDAQGGKS